MTPSFNDYIIKICAPTQEALEDSKKRLEHLRRAPLAENARSAAVGAVVSPTMGILSRAISGDGPPKNRVRKAVAEAIGGAVVGGAMPLVKNRLERAAEVTKIKKLEG